MGWIMEYKSENIAPFSLVLLELSSNHIIFFIVLDSIELEIVSFSINST